MQSQRGTRLSEKTDELGELTYKGKTAMTRNSPSVINMATMGCIFMLSQLRDDLAELIEGLEGKSLSYKSTPWKVRRPS